MASNELDLTLKSAQLFGLFISEMADSFEYAKALHTLKDAERTKALMLAKITNNGTRLPYIQEFNAENGMMAKMMEQKINEFNTHNPNEAIDYFMTRTTDNRFILWVDEDGAKKIEALRRELVIGLGEYFTEVSPSELYKANLNKNTISFTGVTREELDVLKSKPLPTANDFSLAATPLGDGTFKVEVCLDDFITSENREDLFVNLVRANAIINNKTNSNMTKELAYDRELRERIVKYDKSTPTYITSASDTGTYVKITKDKFTVYHVGMNANDVRQTVKKDILLTDYEGKEDEYRSLLYREIQKINNPIEINNEICKQYEKEFEQTFGKDTNLAMKENRIKGIVAEDLAKTRMSFENTDNKNINPLFKQLERNANRNFSAHIAAEIITKNDFSSITPEKIPEILNTPALNKKIRAEFFKEHLIHMEPRLHKEFLKEIEKTNLYKQIQNMGNNCKINPELADELSEVIKNSYEDMFYQINPQLQNDIKIEYLKYENEIKSNAERAIRKGINKDTVDIITKIKDEKENKALQVIIAKCVTDKNIDFIRPIQKDLNVLKNAEFEDKLTKMFAKEVEKKLITKIGKSHINAGTLNSHHFYEAVKETKDFFITSLSKNQLNNWGKANECLFVESVQKAWNKNEISAQTFNQLAKTTKSLNEYMIDGKYIDFIEVEQAEKLEAKSPEQWEMLRFEHDEESISRLMKEELLTEDIDIGEETIERVPDDFHSRQEEMYEEFVHSAQKEESSYSPNDPLDSDIDVLDTFATEVDIPL